MSSVEISRDFSSLNENTREFAETVRDSKVRPGRDYPYVYAVSINGDTYIGFATGLPTSREPWQVGHRSFRRDTVLDADLFEVSGEEADMVNGVLDALTSARGYDFLD